jgi:hypothetical protein
MKVLENDISFLVEHNLMDYSLLLAVEDYKSNKRTT